MRRFLNKLFRDFRTTGSARGGRGAPRRAAPQVEGLEDRMVLTTVTLSGSTALISNMAQGHAITLESTGFFNGFRGLEVFDNGTLVNNPKLFSIDAIKTVNIQASGGDNVLVNDSNGMPFAQHTSISLFGSGANALTLAGSRGIAGNETYVAGGASFTPGEVLVDNLTFTLHNAIAWVNDFFQITGTLDVQTSGSNVVLSGSSGVTQMLSGMGFGGGDTLTYANKPTVVLDEYGANANVLLAATVPAVSENLFTVQMHGAGDSTTIAATPSNVFTEVRAEIAPVANQASVYLRGNAGGVAVTGNSSTFLSVGQPLTNGLFSTKGIQANVTAVGVGTMFLSDSGNVSTQENVTVTESTISGFGLFGNNGVKLFYQNVGTVNLVTGQDGADYTVAGSHKGAKFASKINLTYFSTLLANVPIRADVYVDSGSQLNLQLYNLTTQQGTVLDVHTTGNPSLPGTPSGTVYVSFPGVPNSLSQIGYHNFSLVFAQG
jgi:hypothetical protein